MTNKQGVDLPPLTSNNVSPTMMFAVPSNCTNTLFAVMKDTSPCSASCANPKDTTKSSIAR